MTHEIQKSLVAVDPVILTIREKKLFVYLQQRAEEPFKSLYELPGGLLRVGEDAKTILKRKLSAIVTQEVYFTQFHTFTNPERDPRERVVSIGFIALIPTHQIQDQTHWYELHELPKLAFDHSAILTEGLCFLQKQLTNLLAKQFLPQKFSLNALQEVYEVILDEAYDNRNFRRKMMQSELISETDEYEQNVSHRPAKLYTFIS